MPHNKHRAGKNYKNKNSNTDGGGNESSSSSLLYIEPFMFKQFPELDAYLKYSD
eukprot:CAMPEP_0196814570 /NCGR_PEP_ID=MMETSP1362-20130617/44248_1 /TAXON_ID=163516 /ORGANISM="Leptocylindrus danicus, Strain CCMP1856" /LENGTH=53 /DNA_ID=CAMNT_0042191227 /DNA_START=61 /DNA_END=219 /DNA_ORIENTATION=+